MLTPLNELPPELKKELVEAWKAQQQLPPAPNKAINAATGAIMSVFAKFQLNTKQIKEVLETVVETNKGLDLMVLENKLGVN